MNQLYYGDNLEVLREHLAAFARFRSPVKWNILVSYAFIVGAVFFAFKF